VWRYKFTSSHSGLVITSEAYLAGEGGLVVAAIACPAGLVLGLYRVGGVSFTGCALVLESMIL